MTYGWIHDQKTTPKTVEERPVSVLIAARNESKNLLKLIPKLLNQDYDQFEIIIALDRCTDNSEDVIKQYTDNPRLNYVVINESTEGFSGKKLALTKAIERANNEILIFTDADCIPASSLWLKSVNDSYTEDTQISIGYGPYFTNPGLVNLFIRYETIITALQYFSFAQLGNPYMGVGRNMSYKKSYFIQNDGFGDLSSVTGGDDDLFIGHHATRNNINSYYREESFVYSDAKGSWKSLFIQKQRHLSVGKYYRKKHQLILGLLGGSQVMFWLTFVILATLKASVFILTICLMIRYLSFFLFFIIGIQKIGDRFTLLWTPVLDIVHTLFLLIMGPVGFFTKRVKWS